MSSQEWTVVVDEGEPEIKNLVAEFRKKQYIYRWRYEEVLRAVMSESGRLEGLDI